MPQNGIQYYSINGVNICFENGKFFGSALLLHVGDDGGSVDAHMSNSNIRAFLREVLRSREFALVSEDGVSSWKFGTQLKCVYWVNIPISSTTVHNIPIERLLL